MPMYKTSASTGCRPGHTRGYFESCVFISQELDAKTPYIAYACLRMHRCRMYSVQCSDKMCFLQMRHSKVLPGYPHSSAVPMVL